MKIIEAINRVDSLKHNTYTQSDKVAWLSQLSTPVIFLVSALICVLQYGSSVAATTFKQVDSSFANMLQGAILFLVLAADFFIRFRIARNRKGGK